MIGTINKPFVNRNLFIAMTIIAVAGLIVLLNVNNSDKPNTLVFKESNKTFKNPESNRAATIPALNAKKSSNNPFNSNQTNTQSASNPHLPSGFPELLPPLDQQQLKQNDDLITQGDAIIAKMDALIATIDLPAIKLSDSEKTQLDAQRQIQQTQIEDIKAQLEALQGGLQ